MGTAVSKVLAIVGAGLLTSACAGGSLDKLGGLDAPRTIASATEQPAAEPASSQSELEKATEYWGKEYSKSPRNLDAALSYSKNLKAMGRKSQALAVLQQASLYHSTDRKLASEYGRLALELDQIAVARQLLQIADDPANPDWRVISARGTVLAKQGLYKDAIPLFERATTLAPDQPSIMNNLALAYTMNGEATKAEELLRKAAGANGSNSKVRQNLALVLGLQGKYEEAKRVSGQDLPADSATANAEYMRRMVKLDPKAEGVIAAQPAVLTTKGAAQPAPALKPAAADVSAAAADAWTPKVAISAAKPQAEPAAAANPLFKPSAR